MLLQSWYMNQVRDEIQRAEDVNGRIRATEEAYAASIKEAEAKYKVRT